MKFSDTPTQSEMDAAVKELKTDVATGVEGLYTDTAIVTDTIVASDFEKRGECVIFEATVEIMEYHIDLRLSYNVGTGVIKCNGRDTSDYREYVDDHILVELIHYMSKSIERLRAALLTEVSARG